MDTPTKHPAFQRADALTDPRVADLFPHSADDARQWEPRMLWYPLSSRVLVVAVPRVECAWRAYIDAVDGHNHANEYEAVARSGATVPEDIARKCFPMFDEVPYAS